MIYNIYDDDNELGCFPWMTTKNPLINSPCLDMQLVCVNHLENEPF